MIFLKSFLVCSFTKSFETDVLQLAKSSSKIVHLFPCDIFNISYGITLYLVFSAGTFD